MSVDSFSDKVFLKWIEDSKAFFLSEQIDMKATNYYLNDILNCLKNSKIDSSKLLNLFHIFQDTIDVEFSKKGDYQSRILKKLQGQVRRCMKLYLKKTQDAFENSKSYDRVSQRMHSGHNVTILKFLILREPKKPEKDEEFLHHRFIGLSYAYANLVNGVFRFTLQDCLKWDQIANKDTPDIEKISNMEVTEMQDYFKKKKEDVYFEGYDSIVRNAVAHSNFQYDATTKKMTYVNEKRKFLKSSGKYIVTSTTSEYEFQEMVENYNKIESIYHLIMIFNQMLMVSTACTILAKRHP